MVRTTITIFEIAIIANFTNPWSGIEIAITTLGRDAVATHADTVRFSTKARIAVSRGKVQARETTIAKIVRTGITVIAILVLLAACVVDQQLALSCCGTFPHVAGSRTVGVDAALNFEKFGCSTLCAALGRIFVDTLCVNAGIGGAWCVVIAVRGQAPPMDV